MTTTEIPIVLSFHEDALNLRDYLNHDDITPSKPENIKDLVDNTSKEWYCVGPYQTYTPSTALTEKGKEEYKKVTERALTEIPKDVLKEVTCIPVSCGMWFPDKKSPHYSPDDMIHMCCMTDFIPHGKSVVNTTIPYTRTSLVKWWGDVSENVMWVITVSGSLYHYQTDRTDKA